VPSTVAVDVTTNHITTSGYAYDGAGNLTNDSVNALTYDAENRVITSTQSGATYSYSYDGNGLRVMKTPPSGSATVYIFSGSKVIAEYASGAAPGSPTSEYIYSGSQLVTLVGSATTYHHPDHLSARVSTDSNGNIVRSFGHYPFGETWYETGAASKWKFTSYERDSESLNDYAIARSYTNRQGRFSSPDPLPGSLSNPQSLNRYAYVKNNPISFADPLGLTTCDANGNNCYDSVTVTADGPSGFFGGGGGGVFETIEQSGPDLGDGGDGNCIVNPLQAGCVKQPPPPPGYEQCVTEALQEVLAYAEGTDRGNLSPAYDGYGLLVNGTVYSAPHPFHWLEGHTGTRANPIQIDPATLSGHPGIQVRWNPHQLTSSAFGRYQITVDTAADPRFNITDFSPRGQDAGAEAIMQSLGMVGPAMQGNLALSMTRGNGVWASLPGANAPGQHSISMATAQAVFNNAPTTLPDCL
jgi:RHS repeat-associated protein